LVSEATSTTSVTPFFSHLPSPCFTAMSAPKPPPSLEDQMASLAA
jgi:hypothetical protein